MKATQAIFYVIAGIFIGIILFSKCGSNEFTCKGDYTPIDTVFLNIESDTQFIPLSVDTIHDTSYISKVIPVTVFKTDTLFSDTGKVITQEIDTAAILRDYTLVKTYSDTFDTEFVSVAIHDTIGFNRILGRGVYVHNTSPVEIFIKKSKVKLFIGIGASSQYSVPLTPDAHISAMLIRNKHGLSVNFSLKQRIGATYWFNPFKK